MTTDDKTAELGQPELKKVALADLVPYEHNARTHSKEQIEELIESIKQVGLLNPLAVAEREDGKYDVVGGHGRLEALTKMGVKEVPVVIHHNLSSDDLLRRSAILADNEIAKHAGYDPKELLHELTEISAQRPELLSATGFNEDDIKNLIPDNKVAGEDEFESSGGFKVSKDPFAKSKEIYELGGDDEIGPHRLMCGDSADAADVEALMDGASADLLLTDPPYNVAVGAKSTWRDKDNKDLKNDKFKDEKAYQAWITEVFGITHNVLTDAAAWYIFHATSMTLPIILGLREAGFIERQLIIWAKNNPTLSWSDYQWKFEPMLFGELDPAIAYHDEAQHIRYGFNSVKTRVWNSDRCQPNLVEAKRPAASKLHPTMKPIELLAYFMKNSSRPRDKVLDVFGGSGSTLICCEEIDRQCYMMELDEKYASTILLRYAQHTHWEKPIIRTSDGTDIRDELREWAAKYDLLK